MSRSRSYWYWKSSLGRVHWDTAAFAAQQEGLRAAFDQPALNQRPDMREAQFSASDLDDARRSRSNEHKVTDGNRSQST